MSGMHWTTQRGVHPLPRPPARAPELAHRDPVVSLAALAIAGVGFLAFFAALAVLAEGERGWGLGLVALAAALLAGSLVVGVRRARR